MSNYFKVIRPGINSTFQDLGRFGLQHLGIVASGCMDQLSFCISNKLVGNKLSEGALEFAYQGPLLEFVGESALIAISGKVNFNIVSKNGVIKQGSPNVSFLVLNGDLLTTINFLEIYETHIKEKAAATIATFSRQVNIDFGVLELDNKSQLKKYIEKPTFDYKVSMGINVFNKPSIQNFVKENEYLDIPDLMMKLKKNSHKVLCHEQDCKWLDIGRVDDYEVAQKVFSRDKSIFLPDK